MRRSGRGSVAALVVLVCALSLSGGSARATTESAAVVTSSFPSHALGSRLHFAIYLPAGYATSSKRYPVVYVLHGLPASPKAYQGSQWIAASVQATGRHAIVVFPQGASSAQSDPEYHDWGPGEDWDTALGVELPLYIDSHYRTIRSRGARAIVGFSAGGYGATMLALHHPATYAAVESWSGYFRATDPTGQTTLDIDDASAHALVPTLRTKLSRFPTFIAFYVGRSDPTFVPDNLKFDRELTEAGVRHTFALYAGAHSTSLWETHAKAWLSMAIAHLKRPTAQ
jgi:S-formylglutathione hydrolase FrmB